MNLIRRQTKNLFIFPTRCLSTQQQNDYKPSYYHHVGKSPLVYRTIGQELERATAEYGTTEAIVSVHENQRRTFNALYDEVNRLSAGFYKMGLKKGDRIGIWGPNNLSWYLTMLAAARAGMISVGINPAFQGPEIEYCLKKVNINAVVAPETFKTQNYYEILSSICKELPNSEVAKIRSEKFPHLKAVVIDTNTKLKGAMNFSDCLDLSTPDDAQNISRLQKEIMPDSPCNVQFTSGTTGLPKAAVLSHNNFVNNGIHIGVRNQLSGQRICVQVPLFHAYGVTITIMAAMSHGATLVLPAASFNPEASLHAIIGENCTVIHGTPTMYVDLIKKQKELKLPVKSAKMAITGGSPCSPQLFLNIKNVLGLEHVRTVYGLTETTAVVFQSKPGDSMEQVLHTVGYLTDHVEAKVIDEKGNAVPFGQTGELCVRGYLTSLGYYGDEQKTKELIDIDKWLKTGDQFILQEDGYGRIVGRIKDMIIRGGENIFPKEVEDFLNAHPDVLEAHVIGVPCPRMGEEVCAFVRSADNLKEPLTRNIFKAYGKGKIAHFKIPKFVIQVNDFPKTTSGKIQKFKLLDVYKAKELNL